MRAIAVTTGKGPRPRIAIAGRSVGRPCRCCRRPRPDRSSLRRATFEELPPTRRDARRGLLLGADLSEQEHEYMTTSQEADVTTSAAYWKSFAVPDMLMRLACVGFDGPDSVGLLEISWEMSATRSTGQRRTWCRGRAQCSRSALSASVTLLVLGFGEQVICIRLQVRKMTRPTFIAQLCLLQWMAYFLGEDWAMTFFTAAVLLLLLMRLCMVGVLPTTKGVWRTGGLC